MQHAHELQEASEQATGLSGLVGKLAELVISLKGLLAAIAVLGSLAGLYFTGDTPTTPSTEVQASVGPALPEATGTVGWAIVGKYVAGKLGSSLLKVELAIPQVGETCEALDTIPVYKDNPAEQVGGRILLGEVRKGDTIQVLDMRRKDEKGAPYWVKLRAVLHQP